MKTRKEDLKMDYFDIQYLKELKEMEEIESKAQSRVENRRRTSKKVENTHKQERNLTEFIRRLDNI